MAQSILVVDDNQLLLYGLAKALKYNSYAVQTASTGQKALRKLAYCPFDLCMLDIDLPDFNGLELMKMVKDFCPDTKIIIMTASNLDSSEVSENISTAISNGACHFISKPFDLCDIRQVVKKVLSGEDDFHTGFRFTSSSFEKKSRRSPRKPCSEKIGFQMSVIDQGNYTRWSMEAEAVDISDRGIGVLSSYHLKESQVIGFDEKMDNKTGVVMWSKTIDADKCRVGIKFA
jgi:CheY-like chemotaxis protein